MKKNIKEKTENFKIINRNLNSNQARRECGGCYYYSVLRGSSCKWIDELGCVCQKVIKRDIEYTKESC